MKYPILGLLTGLLFMSISMSKSEVLPLIPQPRESHIHPGHVRLDEKTRIILQANPSESDLLCANQIQEKIEKISGIRIGISSGNEAGKGISIMLGVPSKFDLVDKELNAKKLTLSPKLGEEGYLLNIDEDNILIAAPTEKGVFYGVQSLLQLMEKNRNRVQLPRVTIQDYPLMKIRGVSDDISRGQVSTLDDFKNIIRNLASFKVNYYMPYIEDMFEFEKYPDIGKTRGHITKAEAKELVAYAKRYHIEVVPVFECLGHQDRILSLPQFNHIAETPEKPWCFSPVVESTYTFLENCIKEMVEIFPSPYFCIGCDETYDLGKGKSKELGDKIGKDGLFAQHVLRVKGILDKLGKQTWMYGDMPFSKDYPDLKSKLSKDIVMINWIYNISNDYPRAHAISQWGNPQIISPAVHGWGRIFPDFDEANGNVDHLTNVGYKLGSIGEIQSSWCDFGGENYREFNWYSYAYSADAGWNPDHLHRDWFNSVYFKIFYGTEDNAIRKIHDRLVKTNADFKDYHGTSALILWKDQIDEGTTKKVKFRSARAKRMERIAEECSRLMPRASDAITDHKEHLELFQLVINRAKLLSLRLQIPDKKSAMLKSLKDSPEYTQSNQEEIDKFVTFIKEQKTLLNEIKPEFRTIWLKYYKQPKLDDNLAKYDKLNEYYDTLINEAEHSLSK